MGGGLEGLEGLGAEPPEANGGLGAKHPAAGGWGLWGKPPALENFAFFLQK